jgi:hypothetical protein
VPEQANNLISPHGLDDVDDDLGVAAGAEDYDFFQPSPRRSSFMAHDSTPTSL